MQQLVEHIKVQQCSVGQIIVQMGTLANHVHILKHGECIVAQMSVNSETSMQQLRSVDHAFMCHGDFYGEIMLVKRQRYPASVVAVQQGTVILTLSIVDVVEVRQGTRRPIHPKMSYMPESRLCCLTGSIQSGIECSANGK